MEINLKDTYWKRITGFVSEHRVDARWVLCKDDERSYGSLRIVSHPDLPPGQLRAIFNYVTTMKDKSEMDMIKTVEDYKIDIKELEVLLVVKEENGN